MTQACTKFKASVHQIQRNLLKKALADSGKLNCAASLVGWGGAVAVALSTIDVIAYLAVNINFDGRIWFLVYAKLTTDTKKNRRWLLYAMPAPLLQILGLKKVVADD